MSTKLSDIDCVSDVERWSNPEKLSREWDERARQIASWIPAGNTVLDIGCGNMTVEQVLSSCEYLPVDIVARDDRTTVVDLNLESLPESLLQQATCATLLGVLEYLKHPEDLLRSLCQSGISIVCSYQLADCSSPDIRVQNGWFNAFTAFEFVKLVRECGFVIEKAQRYQSQGLYLLRPAPSDSSLRKVDGQGFQVKSAQSASGARPKLVLSGFFGRGNVGDEALLQVQYETLSKHFDIIISVEQRGAYDGYWNWYPYNRCKLIHQADLAIFDEPDVVGLHLGGGDLPFGFNAGQVLAALGAGKAVTASGIDFGSTYANAAKHHPSMMKNYLELLRPSVRSEVGYENAKRITSQVHLGADWAIRLPADQEPQASRDHVLLVLREFPVSQVSTRHRDNLWNLIQAIQARYGTPVLLPFCPEDERFLEQLECTWSLPREVHWWNPRRIKQLIGQAKLVVSVGRFHPLIFATSTETPVVFSEWESTSQAKRTATVNEFCTVKSQRFCSEMGIAYCDSLNQLVSHLETSQTIGKPKPFGDRHQQRFDEMVQRVLGHLAVPAS